MSSNSYQKKGDLLSELYKAEEKYHGSNAILSTLLLTFGSYNDSNRNVMFSTHILHRRPIKNPEYPKISTSFENVVAKHSSYNYVAKDDYEVIKVFEKFPSKKHERQPKAIFVKNMNTQEYDVIYVKTVENLVEKYGFDYNTDKINNLKKGDIIKNGEELYKPDYYDEYGNYGYGINVPFMLQIKDTTQEDGIEISDWLSENMISPEVELVKVTLNDNEFLLNIGGDKNNYKSVYTIGEHIKNNVLCAKRKIVKSELLFSMKESNTRKILPSDRVSYVDGEVVDIDIFCNKPRTEIPDTPYNKGVIGIINDLDNYYNSIQKFVKELIDKGCKVSSNIKILNKRAYELTHPETTELIDENGNKFSNIVLYFMVRRYKGLDFGSKLTARYGNKGVISRIVPVELMPITNTGKRIHLILNGLGIVNRLIVFPLFEQSLTFKSNRLIERFIQDNYTCEQMEEAFFKFIRIISEDQYKQGYELYKKNCKTKSDKEAYFEIVKKYGIPIIIPPFWQDKRMFDVIKELDDEFKIEPYDVYFYEIRTKRYVKMILPQIVGDIYIMGLKQDSKRGLSVRSTGSINQHGVPSKDESGKNHTSMYSKTPIRFGIQELINLLISIPADVIGKEHLLYRNSSIGRRQLAKRLLTDVLGVQDIEITDKMKNINAEILSAYLRVLGYELLFEHDYIDISPGDGDKTHVYKGETYICTTKEIVDIVSKDIVEGKIKDNADGFIFIGEDADYDDFLQEMIDEVKNNLDKYLK